MNTRLLILSLFGTFSIIPQAFGCTRTMSHLFWSPIIDRVSGDCSFVRFEPNPSGLFFTAILGSAIILLIYWRKRK